MVPDHLVIVMCSSLMFIDSCVCSHIGKNEITANDGNEVLQFPFIPLNKFVLASLKKNEMIFG